MNSNFVRWFDNVDRFFERLGIAFKAMNTSSENMGEKNAQLYTDITGENYDASFVNPRFADYMLGGGYGKLCSFVSAECYSMIGMKFDKKASMMEPFMEMYGDIRDMFEKGTLSYDSFHNRIYQYLYDSCEVFSHDRIRDMLTARDSVARKIVTGSLGDVWYLYRYGDYITDNDIKMARFLNVLPPDRINEMAEVFTKGYRRGFETTGKPFDKKRSVGIIYRIGFERLVKAAMEQFGRMGLETTLFRAPSSAVMGSIIGKGGFYGSSANRQAAYDHVRDAAFFYDEALINKKLGAMKKAYDEFKEEADVYGGPAVIEVFGEEPFNYEENGFAMNAADSQKRMETGFMASLSNLANDYIKGEERSFTIIAYPTPDIGEDFKEIFEETAAINCLDYNMYMQIQQTMIDVLNYSTHVVIQGANGNKTDLTISLQQVDDPNTQENFENCLADVNIPLGEVFTTPGLTGTSGTLFVKNVYLQGFEYKDLYVVIENGFVKDYSCSNFEEEEKNREYFKKNVLNNHDTLPMGEFAIGTNTRAYAMAKRFGIEKIMPILIAEKTGPHFALGDTCYSHAEDVKVFNMNKKEIIAKDNEISCRRKEDPEKAYFNCHTDITIPYEEIGRLTAVDADGEMTDIIRDGRFVLPGTEMLNEALDSI